MKKLSYSPAVLKKFVVDVLRSDHGLDISLGCENQFVLSVPLPPNMIDKTSFPSS